MARPPAVRKGIQFQRSKYKSDNGDPKLTTVKVFVPKKERHTCSEHNMHEQVIGSEWRWIEYFICIKCQETHKKLSLMEVNVTISYGRSRFTDFIIKKNVLTFYRKLTGFRGVHKRQNAALFFIDIAPVTNYGDLRSEISRKSFWRRSVQPTGVQVWDPAISPSIHET